MREIKFRAWDKEKKEMIKNHRVAIAGTGKVYELLDPFEFVPNFNFELMQYTGLKDKNGKEIYEGDICKQLFEGADRITTIGVIAIEPTKGTVVGSTPVWPHDVEVIGNIYENPELIK